MKSIPVCFISQPLPPLPWNDTNSSEISGFCVLHTKAHTLHIWLTTENTHNGISPFQNLNWAKNLLPLPKFTTEQIHNHLDGCGKKDIGSKGYKFFTKSYIHDVYVGYDEGAGHATITALCFRSQ